MGKQGCGERKVVGRKGCGRKESETQSCGGDGTGGEGRGVGRERWGETEVVGEIQQEWDLVLWRVWGEKGGRGKRGVEERLRLNLVWVWGKKGGGKEGVWGEKRVRRAVRGLRQLEQRQVPWGASAEAGPHGSMPLKEADVNSRVCRPPDGAIQMQHGNCTKELGRFRGLDDGRATRCVARTLCAGCVAKTLWGRHRRIGSSLCSSSSTRHGRNSAADRVGALGAVAIPQAGYNRFCREVFAIKQKILGAEELRRRRRRAPNASRTGHSGPARLTPGQQAADRRGGDVRRAEEARCWYVRDLDHPRRPGRPTQYEDDRTVPTLQAAAS